MGVKALLPIALERLSPPFTLPSGVTLPPAFLILFSSTWEHRNWKVWPLKTQVGYKKKSNTSSSGLWSNDISTATPFLHTTHLEIVWKRVSKLLKEFDLESPALAT